MELPVLFALLVAQTPSYAFTNDRRSIALPATFLKPPPLSHYKLSANVHSYIRRMPLINTLDRPQNEKLLQPPNEFWHTKLARTPPDYNNYFHNLACNPCNRVPWIPILGYAYPTNVPPQQPSHSVNIPPNPYYDELSNNIVKPINTVPWYVMPVPTPTYQPYVSNHLWLQSAIQQSPEVHASQQSAPQPAPAPLPAPAPASSLPAPSTDSPVAHVDGLGMSPWISDAQPVPLFHYEHQIEYPNPYEQAPALDLPHQIPQSSLPVPHIPYTTGLGRYSNFNYTDNDITSNHLDDSRYSSSENKFSFTSNVTENDDGSGRAQRGSNETQLLKDYLTPPPSVLRLESEWVHKPSNSDSEQLSSQVESRPHLPDRAPPYQQETVEVKPLPPNRDAQKKPATTEPKSEKKKKQIQIIIPYTINKSKHAAKNLRDDATKTNFALRVVPGVAVSSTTTLPLIKYLKENTTRPTKSTAAEGTDWQKLRKAIDSWTEERFSNPKYINASAYFSSSRGTSTLPPSKVIPKAFLKSAIVYRDDNDLGSGANVIQNRVSSGIKETTTHSKQTTTESVSSIWKSVSLTESPYTKEKVFVVTPLPLTNYTHSSSNITANNWNYL